MMLRTADIRSVTIGVPARMHDRVVRALGRAELIHLAPCGRDESTCAAEIAQDRMLRRQRLAQAGQMLDALVALSTDDTAAAIAACAQHTAPEVELVNDELVFFEGFVRRMERCMAAVQQLDAQAGRLSAHLSLRRAFARAALDPVMMSRMRLCQWIYGTLAVDLAAVRLSLRPGVMVQRLDGSVLVVLRPADVEHTHAQLGRYGFSDQTEALMSDPAMQRTVPDLERRLRDLQARRQRLHAWRTSAWVASEPRIQSLQQTIGTGLRVLDAENQLLFSRDTMFLRGWVAASRCGYLRGLLEQACGRGVVCVIGAMPARDAPVILSNAALFRPFERILRTAGLPGNREIDPTPVTAMTYVILFGLMFGDVGQGLVLVLAGFLLQRLGRRLLMRDSGAILLLCGLSATFFGFCYGSVFSNEHLLPALWFHPMEHIMTLFAAVMLLGALYITLGMVLQCVNALLVRDYQQAVCGRLGVVGLVVYVSLVIMGVRYLLADAAPSAIVLLLCVGLPVLVFVLRDIVGWACMGQPRPFADGVFAYCAETVVELLEMASGFLGNTVSFIRVAAFALSHAGLGIAVYTLADIVSPDGWSLASLAIIVLGNLFIIVLEGLICGIQSLRLEFYEFMSKFFTGDGTVFVPFSLRTDASKGG